LLDNTSSEEIDSIQKVLKMVFITIFMVLSIVLLQKRMIYMKLLIV